MLSTILRVLKKVLVAGAAWLMTLLVVLFIGSTLGLADAGEVLSAVYSLSAVFVPIIVAILLALPKRKKPASNVEASGTEPIDSKAQDALSGTLDPASSESVFLPLPKVPSRRNPTPSKTALVYTDTSMCPEARKIIHDARLLETDLLIMSAHGASCPECAKYQGRVYSISGKSKVFPPIPDAFFKYGGMHEDCGHSFAPYIHRVSDPDLKYTLMVHPLQSKQYGKDIVTFSNRPFLDDRIDVAKFKTP